MLKGMHKRGLKLRMDLVVNHSSDEHEWFKQSRRWRDNPYRQYYHWWPAEKGKPAHRWSFFDVYSEAWKLDEKTNSYYLHYFSQKQPDLNWENPKLRKEISSMMCFWFDKGIDGFRMDVIPFLSKDSSFPPLPPEWPDGFNDRGRNRSRVAANLWRLRGSYFFFRLSLRTWNFASDPGPSVGIRRSSYVELRWRSREN